MEYGFTTFLMQPPAYGAGNTEQGVKFFFDQIIKNIPKVKIILYNLILIKCFLTIYNYILKNAKISLLDNYCHVDIYKLRKFDQQKCFFLSCTLKV